MAAANQVFAWEGTDKTGKKTKGEITSTNANVAKAELRKQGINPTVVKKKGGGFDLSSLGAKITPGDIALFTRQLATMMKAGVPLVQSFEIVADGMDNPMMKDLILKVRDEVSAGTDPLTDEEDIPNSNFILILYEASKRAKASQTP